MRTMTRRFFAVAAFALAIGGLNVLVGCGEFTAPRTGTLQILVTDAPFPFEFIEQALVTITRVDVHRTSVAADPNALDGDPNDPNDLSADPNEPVVDPNAVADPSAVADPNAATDPNAVDDDDTGEWITVDQTEQEFDLLDLQDGRTALLASSGLGAGTYNQIRLVVTTGTVLLTDGRQFDLTVPSGDETGIKLHLFFEIEEGQETTLLVDVDLSRAFQVIPGSAVRSVDDIREFRFRPSFGMRAINVVDAGSITGTVVDEAVAGLANVTVTAQSGGQDVATATTGADGTYTLAGLPAGTYTVLFELAGYTIASVEDVAVTAGQATEEMDATMVADGS